MARALVNRYGANQELETAYKTKQKRDYINTPYLITDNSVNSPYYFRFTEIPQTLTAGKNIVKFAANGLYLKDFTDIDLEVLDAEGNPLFTEFTGYKDRFDFFYAIIYVYDITKQGVGSLTFVGTANNDLSGQPLTFEQKKYINLKWSTLIDIRSTERNTTDIIFQQAPTVSIAQVLVPYKFNLGTYALASRLTTQSYSGLTITTSDASDIDFVENTSDDILDAASKDNLYNYYGDSLTTNTVQTNIRKYNNDVVNGFIYSEYSRYNTILYDPQSRLSKDMEGSIFSFEHQSTDGAYTSSLQFEPPYTSSNLQVTGSLMDQLNAYTSKIVYVLNDKYALLDQAPSLTLSDTMNTINPLIYQQTFKRVSGITGSFIYPTSSLEEIRSQNLSSSFIQFTFSDFQPIAGDVYRIKTYLKQAGSNTEYQQLNDHIVLPPEYLIDSDKPNQAVYAKNKSDAFVYGEFTDASIAIDYWRGFGIEGDGILYQYNYNTTSSYPQANALQITSKADLRKGIMSRYYQTYIPDQPFSLSFYCTLDAGCELEVYMSSTPLQDNALGLQGPKAFNETRNDDPLIPQYYNKFGKFIGKISNLNGSTAKSYDNVTFDFFADSDGFGRPVLYLNTDSAVDKNAYISSISITPLDLVGFTPSILQFAAAPPDSMWILQDDDASLTQSIDLKIEYFDCQGKQSEYTTYIPNVQLNLITEVPGFCSAEASRFNDHCPLYYEVLTNGTTNTTVGVDVTSDPKLYNETYNVESPTNLYFWPTYSLNTFNGFYWNVINFGVGSTYSSANLAWHTSSNTINTLWRKFDPIMPVYDQAMPGTSPFPQMYSASSAGVYSIGDDNQLFWKSNGVLISPIDIAQAIPTYSSSFYVQQNTSRTTEWNTYLKKTRLYYPTNNEEYYYGFNENGGIYNVRFNLKRWPQYQRSSPSLTVNSISGFPDDFGYFNTTEVLDWALAVDVNNRYSPIDGAKLMVYIHDVSTPLLTGSRWQKGTSGFYPPDNNIVTIGNGYSTTPTLRYYDSGSGAFIDTYDLILVQYGDRAQLTFDASGIEITSDEVNSGFYNLRHISADIPANAPLWGGMISDIEWCKIGVTTDPNFIKPTNFSETFTERPKRGTWNNASPINQTGIQG